MLSIIDRNLIIQRREVRPSLFGDFGSRLGSDLTHATDGPYRRLSIASDSNPSQEQADMTQMMQALVVREPNVLDITEVPVP